MAYNRLEITSGRFSDGFCMKDLELETSSGKPAFAAEDIAGCSKTAMGCLLSRRPRLTGSVTVNQVFGKRPVCDKWSGTLL